MRPRTDRGVLHSQGDHARRAERSRRSRRDATATCLAFAGWNRDGSAIVALKYRPLDRTWDESEAEKPSSWLRPIVVGDLSSLDWFVAEGEFDGARIYDLAGDHAILVLPMELSI